jgi:hypothetical protein
VVWPRVHHVARKSVALGERRQLRVALSQLRVGIVGTFDVCAQKTGKGHDGAGNAELRQLCRT